MKTIYTISVRREEFANFSRKIVYNDQITSIIHNKWTDKKNTDLETATHLLDLQISAVICMHYLA